MRKTVISTVAAAVLGVTLVSGQAVAQQIKPADADNFYQSKGVIVEKVTFPNQYKMNIVAHLVLPKGVDQAKKHPAIVVGHPIGAVKEQAATLYATKMAERGFVTLAVDLPFWGESDGEPRNAVARMCMPKPLAPLWITSASKSTLTGKELAVSVSVPVAVLLSAPRRSTRVSRLSPR